MEESYDALRLATLAQDNLGASVEGPASCSSWIRSVCALDNAVLLSEMDRIVLWIDCAVVRPDYRLAKAPRRRSRRCSVSRSSIKAVRALQRYPSRCPRTRHGANDP